MEEGRLRVTPKKTANSTGKSLNIEWTADLQEAVNEVLNARPVDISPYMFCTRRGIRYEENSKGQFSGWQSIWQRFMKRVLAETEIEEKFTEHDIRDTTGRDTKTKHE